VTYPQLVAITVTYNSATVLEDFLLSVRQQRQEPEQGSDPFRTIIIDNGSSDKTVDMLRQIDDPDIEIILLDSNLGVAAANNIGIRRAIEIGAETVLLINNDVLFGSGLYNGLHAWTSRNPNAAVSPVIPYYACPDKIWFAGGEFQWWRGYIGYHLGCGSAVSELPREPFTTGYAPTTCLAIPIPWFEKVGLQDERYFIYWEDTDMARRMVDAGMTIVVDPSLTLYHKVSVTTGGRSNSITLRYIYRNHMIFMRKHHGSLATIWALCVLAMKAMARLFLGRVKLEELIIETKALREGLTMSLIFPKITAKP
jgi:GT2 family glycosyltransferase